MKKTIALIMTIAMMTLLMVGCGESAGVRVIDIPLTQEEYAFGVDKINRNCLKK